MIILWMVYIYSISMVYLWYIMLHQKKHPHVETWASVGLLCRGYHISFYLLGFVHAWPVCKCQWGKCAWTMTFWWVLYSFSDQLTRRYVVFHPSEGLFQHIFMRIWIWINTYHTRGPLSEEICLSINPWEFQLFGSSPEIQYKVVPPQL